MTTSVFIMSGADTNLQSFFMHLCPVFSLFSYLRKSFCSTFEICFFFLQTKAPQIFKLSPTAFAENEVLSLKEGNILKALLEQVM